MATDASKGRSRGSERFMNRELSWLDFNARVLALAEDAKRLLLDRVRFAAIFSSNLDEFFQVRVAGLHAHIEAGLPSSFPDGLSAEEQCVGIRERVDELLARLYALFGDVLVPELEQQGISLCDAENLSREDREHLAEVFEQRIFPVLTPLSVDPGHPFPLISNLSLNLAVLTEDPENGARGFVRVKVPPALPRFLILPDQRRFVPVEQVIAMHLDRLFPGMRIAAHHPFRVTLNADIEIDQDDAEDLMAAVESGLHRRLRMNPAARLEIEAGMVDELRDLLVRELELDAEDVYNLPGPLDLSGLAALCALPRPDLKGPRWHPVTPRVLAALDDELPSGGFFDLLGRRDVLVHHPYDSFATSVERFLSEASRDPNVLAIKHTLYRTADRDNRILNALCRAARGGKEVVALVELKARFDEGANIELARLLEDAGAHVVYGLVGLKTHAKAALVVRQEEQGLRRYCHLGTGNYNASTAGLYDDLGLFTASPEIGRDVGTLFNYLTGAGRPARYEKLWVAPDGLRPALLERIEEETRHDDGRIVLKLNSLSDPGMIDALYAASQSGVEIDLIVRGICCLRPGVPGLSERIRVRSILGPFLEHSRVFRFGSDARGPRYWLGSADMMTRNLNRRVEAVFPIEDPGLRERIEELLRLCLADDRLAWSLGPDGTWERVPPSSGIDAQHRLCELAEARAHHP